MMRRIIGQTESAFDLRDIMDNKKILLVNLSKGRTGELNSKLLGMVFVMKFQAAAMSRANVPEEERNDFALYVDEFQNFSTDSFATIMSEARKYHLNLIVANQFTTQLTDEIRDAVFGNMGTIVSFRIGQNDVEALSRYFQPVFDGDDLLRIPNHNTIIRTLIGGVPTQPFSMATLPPLGTPNPKLAEALKQLSAAKYGRPKNVVEQEIIERLKTKPEPPRPAYGQPSMGGSPLGVPSSGAWPQQPASPFGPPPSSTNPLSAPKAPAAAPSLLDDWLNKRRSAPPPPAPARPATPPPPPKPQAAIPAPAVPQQPAPKPQTTATPPLQPRPTTLSSTPAPKAAEPPKSNTGEMTLDNVNQPKAPEEAEDTIYIDREGNLQQRSE